MKENAMRSAIKSYAGKPHKRFDEVCAFGRIRGVPLVHHIQKRIVGFVTAGTYAAMLTFAAGASTIYVDSVNGVDDAAHTGATEQLAKKTLQAAVDAAKTDDTVIALPGTYEEGFAVEGTYTNRVLITKRITLKSKEKWGAHIVGAFDMASGNAVPWGPAAIRCVGIKNVNNVRIEGFTIRNGACHENLDGINGSGGGVMQLGGVSSYYVVDCVISNCVATRGAAMRNGTAIRCLMTENVSSGNGGAARDSYCYSCIMAHNKCVSGVVQGGRCVNCTLVDTDTSLSAQNVVINSLLLCGGNVGIGATGGNAIKAITNSVSGPLTTAGGTPMANSVYKTVETEAFQCVAPMFDDFRLIEGCAAATQGDGALQDSFTIPEADRHKDFFGNPVPTSGPICAGAIQQTVPVAGGCIRFAVGNYSGVRYSFGSRGAVRYSNSLYAFAETYPTQWQFKATQLSGTKLFCFDLDKHGGRFYPGMDGVTWLMPPPAGIVATNTLTWATGGELYVNPGNGFSDANDGLTPATAKKTLQAAVVAAKDNSCTIVHAAEGVYAEGGRLEASTSNRVAITSAKRILLKGAGGGKSVIKGLADTTSGAADGRGDLAMRCVCLNNADYSVVQGFTLEDGHARQGNDASNNQNMGGCVWAANSEGCQVLDCVLTNGCAARGAAAYCGRVQRCVITGSRDISGGMRYSDVRSSLAIRNPDCGSNSIIGHGCTVRQCTAVGASKSESPITNNQVPVTNTIIYLSTGLGSNNTSAGSYVWESTNANGGSIRANPLFVDAANDDYRVLSCSPMVGGGVLPDTYYKTYCSGIGNTPIQFVNGLPTAGAFQVPVQVLVVSTPSGTVTPSATNVLEKGESVTVDVSGSPRHQIGWTVDGETVEVVGGYTFTATEDVPAGAVAVAPVFDTNWYVNASADYTDANDGWTPATAKHTLVGVMANVVSGDVVHAASGVYNEGSQLHDSNFTVRSRVIVPMGVSLVSDAGPEETFIVGQEATGENRQDEYGAGADAMRCALLRANTLLKGFTLTGGRTHADRDEAGTGWLWNSDNVGSAVLAQSERTSTTVDCVISNNVTGRSAGYCGTYIRCKFLENVAYANSPATRNCYLYNCLVDHNRGENAVQNHYYASGCTFGADNLLLNGEEACSMIQPLTGGVMCNSLSLGRIGTDVLSYNCAFVSGKTMPSANLRTNCVVATAAELAVDADYRPLFGNKAIDAGSNAWVTAEAAPDLDGGQRIYNATVDCGAYEFDWRPRYSRDLAPRWVTVAKASPEVIESDLGTVRILPDGHLDLTWEEGGATGSYNFQAEVTGTGTLSILRDGVAFAELTASDGAQKMQFSSSAAVTGLSFAYTPGENDSGYAELFGFTHGSGTMLLFR